MEAAGVIGEASGFGSKAEVEKERLEAAARCYELSTLVHIEDREDNHCQKEGQANVEGDENVWGSQDCLLFISLQSLLASYKI